MIVRVGSGVMSAPLTYSTENKKVLCYFSNWAGLRDGDGKYVPENIPAEHCTDVVYAFARLDEEKLIPVPSGPIADIDQQYFSRVHDTVKARNPEARVLISLGGWADSAGSKYSDMVNNDNLRSNFVQGTLEFLKLHNFDGMVLEWHFPVCWQSNCSKGPETDRSGFTKLTKDLKTAFGKRYSIGATLSGYQNVIEKAYEVAELSRNLDFINIMAYDLHGFWDGRTGHHSPLTSNTDALSVVRLDLL